MGKGHYLGGSTVYHIGPGFPGLRRSTSSASFRKKRISAPEARALDIEIRKYLESDAAAGHEYGVLSKSKLRNRKKKRKATAKA